MSENQSPQNASAPQTPPEAAPAPGFALRELPSGAVMPEGRWRRSLELIADGWLRGVVEARDPRFYSTFWERNTFGPLPGDVHAEWAGYTADAILRLSHLLPDSWIAAEAGPWLERVLASQDADGYLGAYRPEERWRHGFELWSQDRLLQALLCEYENSGEARVLEACARAGRRLVAQFQTPEWAGLYARPRTDPGPYQAGHSLNIIHPLFRLGELTGEADFTELALTLARDYDAAAGEYSAARFLSAERLNAHIVTLCEHLSIPAAVYAHGGGRRWLEASRRAVDLLCAQSLQVTGVPSGNENTYGRGPRKYTEHCGAIEWMISCSRLLAVTGEVRFADLAERAMMNAYFASRHPHGGSVAYNHAPNQLLAADWTAPYEDNWDRAEFRAHYSSRHEPRCCNANTSRGLPNYVARAALAAPDGGLALVYYGPCRVAARVAGGGLARLAVLTDYPFEDIVRVRVEAAPAEPFALWLRVPGWCRAAEARVNGEVLEPPAPGTFCRIERAWRAGDEVELAFDIPITLDRYEASWHGVPGVAVLRGPLTFALPIPERWSPAEGGGDGADEDWNVVPRADAIWNVALELDLEHPERSLTLERFMIIDETAPWECPPLGLAARARALPHWQADTINGRAQTPGLPPPPLRPAGGELEVTLVPFAFTHIRMTYLPVVGLESTRQRLEDQGKAAGG